MGDFEVMDIKLLKSSIFSNTIPKFLIFFVEEPALYRQYIHSISNTVCKDFEIYSSAKEVIYTIDSNIKDDCIYVIFDDLKISLDEMNRLASSGKNVIVCYNSPLSDIPQEVQNVLKKFNDNSVAFNKVDKDTILAYSLKLCKNNKCSVNTDVLIKLIDYCNCDLGIVMNELNKIFLLEQSNSNVLVNYLLNECFIDYRDVSVWKLVNLILDRNTESFSVCQEVDESPVTILTLLYNSAFNKLKETNAVAYSRLMKMCFSIQKGILDGTIEQEYALKYLMIRWIL